MGTSTATAYKYSVAGHLSFGAQKREKAQKSSGFWADRTYRFCIKDNVLIEPAMGSAAFLNEAINQLAEAYLDRKQKELGEMIPADQRLRELQKVKMYIADRNVYGIDLNPVAVELAEVSLWLNTIYEGGYVPWFGTQLVNGNSLIGARRQCYRVDSLKATSKGLRWFENAPERVPIGTTRADKNYKLDRKQIYHFLLGDPGMCSYSDKVIKSLEPDNVKKMKAWNKRFTAPYTDDDISTLLRLSAVIDSLWEAQVNLRKEVDAKTQDKLSVYGWEDDAEDSQTTIRQKDKILSELYKSEHMRNAGPYARLKFAMDYWCALWFWPIDKANMLPSRSEFFFDMSLILEGTVASVNVDKDIQRGQLTLFPTEMEQMALDIIETYGLDTVVDIPRLRKDYPRLNLAYEIAEQNHFMHWELEFADLFTDKGGFDLILGNPPWIKLKWEEKDLLSEFQPLFAIKDFSATEVDRYRHITFENSIIENEYYKGYTNIAAMQNYLGAMENYPAFQGMKVNLANGFLTNAIDYAGNTGILAFIHPDTPYDATNGQKIRRLLYPRLRYHFHFINELRLFAEVHHNTVFSLNVYNNKKTTTFDAIFNLFSASTIDACYEPIAGAKLDGMKNELGNWNVEGHTDRIIHISKNDINLFGRLFDENYTDNDARLPVLHARQFLDILRAFSNAPMKLVDFGNDFITSEMWHETNSTKNGIIRKNVHFPEEAFDIIYSGSHIGNANALFKTSRENCTKVSDFDAVDLTTISDKYFQRINYSPGTNVDEYLRFISDTPWGNKYISNYRVVGRRMLDLKGAKTIMASIIPPNTAHLNSIHGWAFKDTKLMVLFSGLMASNVYDFFIKIQGKDNLYDDNTKYLPLDENVFSDSIRIRALRLNCVSCNYSKLWKEVWNDKYRKETWAYKDSRLTNDYCRLSSEYSMEFAFRNDYERRMALVEIDVLAAMSLNLSLNQLQVLYKLSFFAAIQQELDTWYDLNGRIVFTNNRALSGVGVDRKTWENEVKKMQEGEKYIHRLIDNTKPEGPIERIVEYIPPFIRCNRERDYEIVWDFFNKKYGIR